MHHLVPRGRAGVGTVVVLGAVLLTGACALDETEQRAADNLRQEIVGNTASQKAMDEAECVAGRWVGEVGVKRLARDGLITRKGRIVARAFSSFESGSSHPSPATAEGYAASVISCQDLDEIAADESRSYPGADEDAVDDYADCLKEIPIESRRQAIVDRVSGRADSKVSRQVSQARMKCLEILK